jgi:hypothetical protein
VEQVWHQYISRQATEAKGRKFNFSCLQSFCCYVFLRTKLHKAAICRQIMRMPAIPACPRGRQNVRHRSMHQDVIGKENSNAMNYRDQRSSLWVRYELLGLHNTSSACDSNLSVITQPLTPISIQASSVTVASVKPKKAVAVAQTLLLSCSYVAPLLLLLLPQFLWTANIALCINIGESK